MSKSSIIREIMGFKVQGRCTGLKKGIADERVGYHTPLFTRGAISVFIVGKR